ncbi:hypothetical protein IM40_06465 [Candidatus Paracaedimonas acanthamoebae]|nr:hypothetical protein IM40_06465 [Candidatus Paracaedimonas acanthamoebae]
MSNYLSCKLLMLVLMIFTSKTTVNASDQISYLEDSEFGKVTAQTFVKLEEDKRLDLYDRFLDQSDIQNRLTSFIDELTQINEEGNIIFEVGVNLRGMMKNMPETELKNFLSRKAAECIIHAYLHHYQSSECVVMNYFKRAKPILDQYKEDNPQIFKLLVDLAQEGWCKI